MKGAIEAGRRYPAVMRRQHNKQDESQSPVAGSRPHLYQAQDIPRFRHRVPSYTPRWSSVLGLAWGACVFAALVRYSKGIQGTCNIDRWDAHYIIDGFTYTIMLVLVSLLWASWEREEKYPELLPKREFERRYPPSSAAPPPREYHRRIPYVEDVTGTGSVMSGQKLDPRAEPMIPMPKPPADTTWIQTTEPGHADPAIIRNAEGDKKYERLAREAAEQWNADRPGDDRCG
jgi:hypothetical protein